MRAALTSAGVPVDFVTIPGGDHGFTNPAHSQRAMELTVSWFERYLLKK
jgi:dipeptidyl aminopeptidase/acylaminoacyl peptidase